MAAAPNVIMDSPISLSQPKDMVSPPSSPTSAGGKILSIAVFVLAITWVLFGVLAFIFSLICFGYSGSVLEKLLGLLLAVFFGPFYFIYYFASGSYCKAMPPTMF
jgi:hypothetical protein